MTAKTMVSGILEYTLRYSVISIFLLIDNTVEWFDGSPIHYSNWGIEKPEVGQLKGKVCIALRTTDGVWQLSPCQEKKGFICKTTTGMNPS